MSFPEIQGDYICIDIETYDPNLKEKGCGGVRKDGYILGVAVADAVDEWYFPINHVEGNGCWNELKAWLLEVCAEKIVVGQNIIYDLEWLWSMGCPIKGRAGTGYYDTQIGAFLLDTQAKSYNLDSLAERYLPDGAKKATDDMVAWYESHYGRKLGRAEKIQSHLRFMPADLVGSYAKMDTRLTYDIMQVILKEIEVQGMQGIFNLESRVLQAVLDMRLRGVRFDVERAEQVYEDLTKQVHVLSKELNDYFTPELVKEKDPVNFFYSNSKYMAQLIQAKGFTPPKTFKDNLSLTREYLRQVNHPMLDKLARFRTIEKNRKDFVRKYLDSHHNGRLYYELSSTYTDREFSSGGTRYGRFSCSRENLQQVPSRDPEWKPIIRGMFLPEEGCYWGRADYSQQEPRLATHYGVLFNMSSALQFAEDMRGGKDFHTAVNELVCQLVQMSRGDSKAIGLGRIYARGNGAIAGSIGQPVEVVKQLMTHFDREFGYMKSLSYKCQDVAKERGYIKTLLGRQMHFNKYEPSYRQWNDPAVTPLYRAEAIAAWGTIKPYKLYTALNRLIQGSAADMTKKAIVDLYDAGLCPSIPVHDEVNFLNFTDPEQGMEAVKIMENCVDLKVPVVADWTLGSSWGSQFNTWEEYKRA